jgi:hypothetical protein
MHARQRSVSGLLDSSTFGCLPGDSVHYFPEDRYLEYLWARVVALFRVPANRRAVEEIAKALLAHRELTGEQALRIFVAQTGTRLGFRRYAEIPLRGGPKDGHKVRVRLRKDGTGTTKGWRSFKVRGGQVAEYRYDDEQHCYQFQEP